MQRASMVLTVVFQMVIHDAQKTNDTMRGSELFPSFLFECTCFSLLS